MAFQSRHERPLSSIPLFVKMRLHLLSLLMCLACHQLCFFVLHFSCPTLFICDLVSSLCQHLACDNHAAHNKPSDLGFWVFILSSNVMTHFSFESEIASCPNLKWVKASDEGQTNNGIATATVSQTQLEVLALCELCAHWLNLLQSLELKNLNHND